MTIPEEIIDNSRGNKLISFLNERLKENPETKLDIATAFFNINAFAMVKDNLDGVESAGLPAREGCDNLVVVICRGS